MSEFLRDILEEHLEEADFLFGQRRAALFDDVYDLADLAELEERLLAHVDGLVVAGEEGWELLAPKLTGEDAGEAFTAALAALASNRKERREAVLAALPGASEDGLPGLVAALQLIEARDLHEPLRELVAEAEAPLAAAVIDILAFWRHGLVPEELRRILASEDAPIRRAGLRAAAAMGWTQFAGECAAALADDDPQPCGEAVACAWTLGHEDALRTVREQLAAGETAAADLQIWLGLGGESRDGALLAAGLQNEELARGAVVALGWLGDPGRIDDLVALLGDPGRAELWRAVAAAIVRITGVDLRVEGLLAEGPPPDPESEPGTEPEPEPETDEEAPDESAGSDEEQEEEDDFAEPLEDPDEDLPWPDPDRLTAWWQEARSGFVAGRRLRYGRPFDRAAVVSVLKAGGMGERQWAARELARLTPGEPLLETRALAWHQNRRMARISVG